MKILNKYIRPQVSKLSCSLLALGMLGFSGCIEKSDDVIGTEVKSAGAGFEMTEYSVSTKTPDFTDSPLSFNMKFNQEVTSTITIKGLNSGTTKTISSTGQDITTTWRGGHDDSDAIFFKDGEVCVAEVFVFGKGIIKTDTITINKSFDFQVDEAYDVFPNGFESSSGWAFSPIASVRDTAVTPIQGTRYLKMTGTAASNSVFVGWASNGSFAQDPIALVSGDEAPSSPDEVWFNIYAYGTGDTESEVYFTMFEKDYDDRAGKNTDDGIQARLTFDHTGWKLFSFKYADIPFKTFNATTGNNTREPNRMILWDVALQTVNQGGSASAIMDFPIITVGGPFDPSKY
ncbi:MAG: hypothetical protein GY827_06705 [Cytophagales bacterium]|nr:hypothetical protein [Cytophagales bacterium]